jgi:hypothetical protein
MNKILSLLLFLTLNSYSQNLNVFYTSFSSTNIREHRIRFLNDSIIQFHNIPTHMSRNISFTTRYYKENGNIIIEIQHLNESEKNNLKLYSLEYLVEKKIILTKSKKELIDNETVYVEQKILNKNFIRRKSITIIDDEKIIVDRGITNGYGLIEKMPKENKKITKFIIENGENPKYKTEIIRGLKAYKTYGILGINGVCIFTKTE